MVYSMLERVLLNENHTYSRNSLRQAMRGPPNSKVNVSNFKQYTYFQASQLSHQTSQQRADRKDLCLT